MKVMFIALGTRYWNKIKYICGGKDNVIEKEYSVYRGNGRTGKETYQTLVAGNGWSFLDHEAVENMNRRMRNAKTVVTFRPRTSKVHIVYRQPNTMVYLVDQPRVPMWATMMHHHGTQKSPIGEDFKCTRCGKEVPAEVKAQVMAETLMGIK